MCKIITVDMERLGANMAKLVLTAGVYAIMTGAGETALALAAAVAPVVVPAAAVYGLYKLITDD